MKIFLSEAGIMVTESSMVQAFILRISTLRIEKYL